MPMGVHVARHARTPALFPLLCSIFLSILVPHASAQQQKEGEPLLQFKDSLKTTDKIKGWDPATPICNGDLANWQGVLCLNNVIWGLKLESLGLTGTPNFDLLEGLPNLRTISLMNNNLEGALPNIKKLRFLKTLYLTNNRFSGTIPDDAFSGLNSIKKVYLGNNRFIGQIPGSLATLPNLSDLRLQGNRFSGTLPDFSQAQHSLKIINFANNELHGSIPETLRHFDVSAFAGNDLCGPPLGECDDDDEDKETTHSSHEVSILKIVIIILTIVLVLGLIALIIICINMKKQNQQMGSSSMAYEATNDVVVPTTYQAEKKTPAQEPDAAATKKKSTSDYGKLSFLKEDIERFDLHDMLTSAAEVLGSGTFGASYKTVISSGRNLVVKRYKQMNNVGREFFVEHMRRIGRLQHPNLLPLVAFYYRKEEKLLVTEFVDKGSLASLIHGNHTQGLDWKTRLKIIKGVTRGLAELHKELPSIALPHGHLKSSNVLINKSFEPLLSDYALIPLINHDQAHLLLVAYKSPEYTQTGKVTKKSDIWSLGILILELLTGKFPENYVTPKYDPKASIASWVNQMVKDKKTSEVFDEDMGGAKNCKGELINLLKIGLSCCEEDVDSRMELKEVVQKIEELKEGDDHDEQDHGSEGGYAVSCVGTEDEYFSRHG